jgi:uncharacterized protein (DUF1778 family)
MPDQAKTEFLQIRVSPEDRARFERAAEADHLEVSTWARRLLLQAAERWETAHPPHRKVAEPAPPKRK